MISKGYAVIDLETSGLHPVGDRITEIAVLLALPDQEPKVESHLVGIDRPLKKEIVDLTGITDAMLLEDGWPAEDALGWFSEAVGQLPIIGHNVFRFDRPFLLNELARSLPSFDPEDDFLPDRFIDTAAIVKGRKIGQKRKKTEPHHDYAMRVLDIEVSGATYGLQSTCKEMGIPTEGLELHRAAGDATLTYRLFEALLKQLGVR